MKRSWVCVLAAAAFIVGLVGPAVALAYVTPWEVVHQNPGTNCTLGHAVINNTTVKAGSTAISKTFCSSSAADALRLRRHERRTRARRRVPRAAHRDE